MNTIPSPKPRLICRAVRLWNTATEREPARHLETCAECREFFNACSTLEASLRRDRARAAPPVPADLERSIIQAVRTSRAVPEASAPTPGLTRLSPRWVTRGIGVAAAAAAGIALVITFQRETPRPATEPPLALAPADVAAIVNSAAAWSDRWWNTVVPSATTAIRNNALQEEFAAVYADARSALDFLALNFLPTQSANASVPPTNSAVPDRRI